MRTSMLQKYARLIAETGANVQPDQEVFISADLDQPDFVEYLVTACYEAGAKKVVVDWYYQALDKVHTKYRSL